VRIHKRFRALGFRPGRGGILGRLAVGVGGSVGILDGVLDGVNRVTAAPGWMSAADP
jgi:hypothetical protein